MTARKYAVSFAVPESVIAELGEDTVLQTAREQAARKVAREAPGAQLIREDNLPETFPTTNPETGEPYPPIRFYRFTYRLEVETFTPPDDYWRLA